MVFVLHIFVFLFWHAGIHLFCMAIYISRHAH